MLLPYEYEFTCLSCGYSVNKRKHELSKIQRKKIIFNNRLKDAEFKIFCISEDVNNIYESNDYDKLHESLSTLKNKKLQIISILIGKYKGMLEHPVFEHDS